MKVKKIVGWLFAILLAFVLLLGVGIYALQRSQAFHQWALRTMIQKAREATGARIEVQDFAIHWSALQVDLDNVTVHGEEGARERSLFTADHVKVGLKIVSIFRRKIDLNEIVLTHPVFNLIQNRDGTTNLPRRKDESAGPVSTNLFNLAVKHVAITSGDFYYNNEKIPLSADLRDLQAAIRFETLKSAYSGTLSYDRGRFVVKDYTPFEHAVKMQFVAAPSELLVNPLDLTVKHSHITLRATLQDYSNPQIQGDYQAEMTTADVAEILKEPSIPVANVSVNGSVRYQNRPSVPFLDALYVDGRFKSSNVPARVAAYGGEARDVRGQVRIQNGDLYAKGVEGEIYDGHLNADFELRHMSTSQDAKLVASIQRMSLQSVAMVSGEPSLKQLPIVGRVDAKANLSWHGSMKGFRLESNATITSPQNVSASTTASSSNHSGVPVDGSLHLSYHGARSVLSLNRSYLKTPHTNVNLDGTISDHSVLTVQATTTDLQEIDLLVLAVQSAIAPSPTEEARQFKDLQGAASLNVKVLGAVKDPRISGNFSATNLQSDGIRLRTVRANLDVSPSQVALHNGELSEAATGRLGLDGTVGLDHWRFSKTSLITAQITSDRMPVADLQQIAGLQYPVTGNLTAKISVNGSVMSPDGKGSIELTQATIYDEPVQSLAVQFQGTGDSIHSTANLKLVAGALVADVTYAPKAETYEAKLSTTGIKLEQLPELQKRGPISGILVGTVNGHGAIKQPQLTINAQVNQLLVGNQPIQELKAQIDLVNQHANFTLQSQIAQNVIDAKGGVNLTGVYDANVTLDTKPFPIGELIVMYVPGAPADIQGQTEIHATLRGPLKEPARIEAHVSLPSLSMAYGPTQLASAQPIRLDYQDGVVTLTPAEFKGTGTDLYLRGSLPIKGGGALNASAHGTVDMALLRVLQKGADSSGQVNINVEARGELSHPSVQGKLQIVNAAYSTPAFPIGFDKVNGELQLQGNRVQISQLTAQAGGGTITGAGFAVLGSPMTLNLSVEAADVRVRYPRGVRALVDSKITWLGTSASSALAGDVTIRRLSFTNQFDLSSFVAQFTGESVPAPSSTLQQDTKLNISIESTEELALASSQLSLQGSANMRLAGSLADPVLLGRATLSSGDIYFLGNRYDIQSGVINFANPVRTEPVVNLYVTTTVSQYDITMNFIGPIDQLRTTYSSTPPLPPADIINMLAFGKTMEEQATSPSTPTSLGAESVLAQGVGSVISSQVQNFAGLSQFSIAPALGGDQTDPSARLAIQQHITGNLIFSFSTDLSGTQQDVVGLEYRTKKKLGFSVVRDEYGGYALTIRLHKDY
jgi:translocation and assembly module TamB